MAKKIKGTCPHCGKPFTIDLPKDEKPNPKGPLIEDVDLIGAMFEEELPKLDFKTDDMNWINTWLKDHNCLISFVTRIKISTIFLKNLGALIHP